MQQDQAQYPPAQPATYLPPGQQQYPVQQPVGYQPPPPYGFQQQPQPIGNQPQHTTVVVAAPVRISGPNTCAFCGGHRRDTFTLVGLVLAFCCFPVGIICCLLMTEKRCSSCGR